MQNKMIRCIQLAFYFLLGILINQEAYAASYQFFIDLNFDNPTMLNRVKKLDVVLGDSFIGANFKFTGTNGPFSGRTTSHQWDSMPFGRVAFRVNKCLVLGVDVTSPILSDVKYPRDSVARFGSTRTILRGYCVSPRFSYQVCKNLVIGAGFVANNVYDARIGFVVPPFEMFNNSRGSNWAYGWVGGLTYMCNPQKGINTTYLSLSYYSKLTHSPVGTSTWGPFTTNNFTATAILPAVYSFNLTQFFSKEWLVSATIRYVEWSPLRNLFLQNTAIGGGPTNLNLPLHYHNSWYTEVATRYQVCNKWALTGFVVFESAPQPTHFRPIGLPAYKIWAAGIAPEYTINKALSVKFCYAHGFSNPPINTIDSIGPLVGDMNVNGDLVGLTLAYRV